MKHVRRYGLTLVAAAGVVTVVLLATGWGSAVAAQVSSVLIVNGTSQAVPVEAVGTVAVHEQGTVPVRSAEEEVAIHDQVENDGANSCSDGNVYTVPAGKELVVEYIAAQNSGGATRVLGSFSTSTLAKLPLVFAEQVTGIFSASEAIHFVVPPSVTLRFNGLEAGNGSCLFFVTLGGHLDPA